MIKFLSELLTVLSWFDKYIKIVNNENAGRLLEKEPISPRYEYNFNAIATIAIDSNSNIVIQ